MALALELGADVKPDNKGVTPLHSAMMYRLEELVEPLIAAGCDVNGTTEETHSTPLMAAARMGLSVTIQRLVESGALLDATDNIGSTALYLVSHPAVSNSGSIPE